MTGHTATVYRLDWSPDATRLATASDDGTARISEIADGGIRELVSFSAQDTGHGLNGVAFSPDGERLMTGDQRDHRGEDLGCERNRRRRVGERADEPFPSGVQYRTADFTPDSRGLVVSGVDGGVSIWDIETGDRLAMIGHALRRGWRPVARPERRRAAARNLRLDGSGRRLGRVHGRAPVRRPRRQRRPLLPGVEPRQRTAGRRPQRRPRRGGRRRPLRCRGRAGSPRSRATGFNR